jgi:hypothetical protein
MPEDGAVLSFEGETVLGFVVAYKTPAELLNRWKADVAEIVGRNQVGLRRAQRKTWNAYVVLLAAEAASYPETVAMAAVEEDLTAARKIAQGGVSNPDALQGALIALLPLRHAPSIEAVDMRAEIKVRTTELPSQVVEAFLSGASEASVLQILEEAS